MLVEWMPQPAPVESNAPAARIKRLAHLEDDWSNVACCSAMRPRPTPRPGPAAREPDVAWPAPTETPPLEHVA
jgi:hypothetical protein